MSKGQYASHLPILKKVLKENDIKVIIEDGGGYNSTPLFLGSNAIKVCTVEEEGWWRQELGTKYKEHLGEDGKWLISKTWDSYLWLSSPDLVFIDGPAETRAERANDAFKAKVPFVVIHDTEEYNEGFYHLSRLEPIGYSVVHYRNAGNPKRTSLYTYD